MIEESVEGAKGGGGEEEGPWTLHLKGGVEDKGVPALVTSVI